MIALVLSILIMQGAYLNVYESALDHIAKGDLKHADIALQQTLAEEPGYLPALKTRAEVLEKMKRYPEAIVVYSQILERQHGDAEMLGNMARLYSWLGQYDKSIVVYKEAIMIDSVSPSLKTGLARVLRWNGRFHEAAEIYREVLNAFPDNHSALEGLAKSSARMGNYAEAGIAIDKAIKLYPDNEDLYIVKGNVFAWQQNYHEALEALSKAVAIAPDMADAYVTRGDVYLWMKSYRNAIAEYKKALALDPDNDNFHLLLSKAYIENEDRYLAVKHLESALQINPVNKSASEMLEKINGKAWYSFFDKTAHLMEFVIYTCVLVMVFLNFRLKRNLLKRKHKVFVIFTNVILPLAALITFGLYVGQHFISEWLDIDHELLHSISESVLFFVFGVSFLMFLLKERRIDSGRKEVVLAIGAHPDDIELGCSGYIMKAKDSGAEVYGLVLTKGEMGNDSSKSRVEEQQRAARFMGLDGVWVLDFPDTKLSEHLLDLKDAIQKKIDKTGATVVLTHTADDIHSDHRAVFKATKEAARKTSVVLSYEDVSTPQNFRANYYADITGYMGDKEKLLSFHKTQAHRTYMDPEVIKGRAAHRGLHSGVRYAEAFRVYRFMQ